ncbi:glycosyltransferase family 4 protein [Rhodanobacter sp. A1T4]|uniref:glycosyltransferase family 4 protein n=1 Tax=Rhodanobacter sp. A1T4 TaxID=2723087 RepID=UPI001619A0D6|nr:glycosyltransferase family 4 protein [Rhodanobacter sp. A1T4]MBB6248915.1 glycosyltransferase involved in cell wall biosynthesis [Rhodanobacter sp. A1T4]
MKLLFTNFHDGDGGGHTTYVMTLAKALATRHEVHVAVPPTSRLYLEASAEPSLHAWSQPFPNGLKRLAARRQARRRLATLLREQDFDLVHVNGSADHRLVMAAVRGLPRRPRIVLTKHNSKPMTGLGHWWRARRGTDMVIAVCDYTYRALAISPYRGCRLTTVHNGVDIAHFAPWTRSLAAVERQHCIGDPSVLLLGSNAGTAAYKGWMDLVEALALLPLDVRAQIHLLVAGRTPDAARQQRIGDLGLSEQVHFPGLLEDVRPALAAIDAGFVLSWDVETISFACREMMAMGKPVLVSEYAGLPENIRPDVDGWLVPPRDHQAMAERLRQLLQQRADLPSMGVVARAHAEQAFGLDLFVERTETAYTDLLAASR